MIEIIKIETTDDQITAIHYHVWEGADKWYGKLDCDIPFADQTDEELITVIESEVNVETVQANLQAKQSRQSQIEVRRPVRKEVAGKSEVRFERGQAIRDELKKEKKK